jgi:hypothetical protein
VIIVLLATLGATLGANIDSNTGTIAATLFATLTTLDINADTFAQMDGSGFVRLGLDRFGPMSFVTRCLAARLDTTLATLDM